MLVFSSFVLSFLLLFASELWVKINSSNEQKYIASGGINSNMSLCVRHRKCESKWQYRRYGG